MSEKYNDYEFNYASFHLDGYVGDGRSSSQLLRDILFDYSDKDFPDRKKVIDRLKNQKGDKKRELVIVSNRISADRYFGRIALIKEKAPFLLTGTSIVEEIKKRENARFIDVTNFIIHFSMDSDPVVMCEFNNEGPRLSDIEYYIRQIAKQLRIAKSVQSILHLNIKYEQLDKELENVLEITTKVNFAYANRVQKWLGALRGLSDETGYRDVRIQLGYNKQKDVNGKYPRNIKGTSFGRNIINWLTLNPNNIDYLQAMKMTYIAKGESEPVELDFIKNKTVSRLKVHLFDGASERYTDFRDVAGNEFNYYLRTGKTNE